MADGGWNPDRVDAFREAFYEFLPYVVINSKETGGNTRLIEHLYRAQQDFYEVVFDALARDIHNIFVLKSRQLGMSTAIRPLVLFWAGMLPGLTGAMIYNTAFNTRVARNEIKSIIKNLPPRLHFPGIKGDSRDGLLLENDQQILFMSAGGRDDKSGGGLGRSIGINFGHFSEISSWASETGLKSLKQSLAQKFPDRLFIWESTARGYELWNKEWEAAREDPDNNECFFSGWWSHNDQQIERGTPDFSRYGMAPPNHKERTRINAVREMYGWEVSMEQLAWYRKLVDPTQVLDEEAAEDSILLQEQPWTEEEAFQQTGASFFQSDKLTEVAAKVAKEKPAAVYRFIPGLSFVESQVEKALMRREVELRIWEEPAPQSTYIVAGDPAFGHSENNDHSAAQVIRCYADGIDQVAEYASGTIQPHHFAWLLWTLVGYYSSKQDSRSMMIVEINGPGEEVWRQYKTTRQLLQQGYLRGRAKDKGIADIYTNAMSYIYQRSDSPNMGHSEQWKTNEQIKIQAFEGLRNYMNNDMLLLHSLEVLEEMKSITRDGDSVGAEGIHRDDRTFALAMAVRCWDDKIRRRLVGNNQTRQAERARLSLRIEDQYALWRKNTFDTFMRQKAATRLAAARASTPNGFRGAMRRQLPPRGRFS